MHRMASVRPRRFPLKPSSTSGGRLAVRPTRVRRLRIHRAIQAIDVRRRLARCCRAACGSRLRTHVTLVVDGRAEAISTNSSNVRRAAAGRGLTLDAGVRVAAAAGDRARRRHDRGGESGAAAPGVRDRSLRMPTRLPEPTDVGVWVVERTSCGPVAGIAAELDEAPVSAPTSEPLRSCPCEPSWRGRCTTSRPTRARPGNSSRPWGSSPTLMTASVHHPAPPFDVDDDPRRPGRRSSTRVVRRADPVRRAHGLLRRSCVPGHVDGSWMPGVRGARSTTERVTVGQRPDRASAWCSAAGSPARPVDERRLLGPEPSAAVPRGPDGQRRRARPAWRRGTTRRGRASRPPSPWLPFGTQVTVTDVATGRSVIVVINDRGPFSPGPHHRPLARGVRRPLAARPGRPRRPHQPGEPGEGRRLPASVPGALASWRRATASGPPRRSDSIS